MKKQEEFQKKVLHRGIKCYQEYLLASCRLISIELAPLTSNEKSLYWKLLKALCWYSDGIFVVSKLMSTWKKKLINFKGFSYIQFLPRQDREYDLGFVMQDYNVLQ